MILSPKPTSVLARVNARHLAAIGRYFFLLIMMVFMATPLVWLLSAGFKRPGDVLSVPVDWIPPDPQPDNFRKALFEARFNEQSMFDFLTNSLLVALVTALLAVGLSLVVAYGFTAYRFRGRDPFMWTMLSTGLLPLSAVVIPLYLIIERLGLLDNLWALVVPFILTGQSIFLARQFLVGFPRDLIESARIDGASEIQVLRRVVMPLMGPAAATIGIMTFLFSWSLFLWPLIVISSQENFTAPLGLSLLGLGAAFNADLSIWMAAAAISIVPPLLFFIAFEGPYLRGLDTMSGIKG